MGSNGRPPTCSDSEDEIVVAVTGFGACPFSASHLTSHISPGLRHQTPVQRNTVISSLTRSPTRFSQNTALQIPLPHQPLQVHRLLSPALHLRTRRLRAAHLRTLVPAHPHPRAPVAHPRLLRCHAGPRALTVRSRAEDRLHDLRGMARGRDFYSVERRGRRDGYVMADGDEVVLGDEKGRCEDGTGEEKSCGRGVRGSWRQMWIWTMCGGGGGRVCRWVFCNPALQRCMMLH
jgi:hypothetical protein